MDSTQPIKQPVENEPRPIAITLICIALFASVILNLLEEIGISSDWPRSWIAICGYVVIVAIIGLWKMRRWAVLHLHRIVHCGSGQTHSKGPLLGCLADFNAMRCNSDNVRISEEDEIIVPSNHPL
jgi:hypothetical protein